MRMNMYGQYFLYALLKDHSNYSLCGKYSLEACVCVWGCVCACYGWPDMPSILPHYDHFDGFRSKKWMLNEIICYKLSLSRIIYVINIIFSVVKIFSGKILILFIAYSKSRRPYFPASTHDDVCTDPHISYPLHCTHCLLLLCGAHFLWRPSCLLFLVLYLITRLTLDSLKVKTVSECNSLSRGRSQYCFES